MNGSVKNPGTGRSLCRDSYNRAALPVAQSLLSEDADFDIFELYGISGFDRKRSKSSSSVFEKPTLSSLPPLDTTYLIKEA